MIRLRASQSAKACFLIVAIACTSTSCRQSPQIPFARAIDQAASWAAAIRYAYDLENQRAVPAPYLKQIVKEGGSEIGAVRQSIEKIAGLPANLKARGVALCEEMRVVLIVSINDPLTLDVARLQHAEETLRSLVPTVAAQ
jgi:hypothetical protein